MALQAQDPGSVVLGGPPSGAEFRPDHATGWRTPTLLPPAAEQPAVLPEEADEPLAAVSFPAFETEDPAESLLDAETLNVPPLPMGDGEEEPLAEIEPEDLAPLDSPEPGRRLREAMAEIEAFSVEDGPPRPMPAAPATVSRSVVPATAVSILSGPVPEATPRSHENGVPPGAAWAPPARGRGASTRKLALLAVFILIVAGALAATFLPRPPPPLPPAPPEPPPGPAQEWRVAPTPGTAN
jgi:hypothetical protein